MNLTGKLILSGVLTILIIGTGIWVSSLGRPINTRVLTVHKLVAIAFSVLTTVVVIGLLKTSQIQSVSLIFLIIAGIAVIVLFATGAILSFEKPASKIILIVHAFTPIITIVSFSAAFFLLIKGKN